MDFMVYVYAHSAKRLNISLNHHWHFISQHFESLIPEYKLFTMSSVSEMIKLFAHFLWCWPRRWCENYFSELVTTCDKLLLLQMRNVHHQTFSIQIIFKRDGRFIDKRTSGLIFNTQCYKRFKKQLLKQFRSWIFVLFMWFGILFDMMDLLMEMEQL